MRTLQTVLALLVVACGGPREAAPSSATPPRAEAEVVVAPPDEPEPTHEATIEAPVEAAPTEAATATSAALEAPTCDPGAAPMDPREALFTVGHVHRWLELEAWHSDLRSPPQIIDERVVERVERGRYTVARVERRLVRCLGDARECPAPSMAENPFLRIRHGRRIAQMACGERTIPETEAATRALFDRCAVTEVPEGRARRQWTCLEVGCGELDFVTTVRRQRRPYPSEVGTTAWIRPGLGVVGLSSEDYSAETGDGTTSTRLLVGWALTTPVSSPPPSDPPASFEAARVQLHELAEAGDPAALAPLLAADVRFSVNPEHTGAAEALEAWGASPAAPMRALAEATAGPCGASGAGVVCPRPDAIPPACASVVDTTRPRALFVQEGSAWRLAALLLGGEDDVFYAYASYSDPPRPWSQRQR
ncbi:MAG: hypothetical protein KC619_11865 [Myxococcales bacterium]|nr:hypothetical protein [Myxococcales bacterium]